MVAFDIAAIVVGNEHRAGFFQEDDVVRPCQVFADEDLGIVTVFVVFQDLPGRDTELARVTDVDVITLSEGVCAQERSENNRKYSKLSR